MIRPTHCPMCGEELRKNYELGIVCPKLYGDWYHFSIGCNKNDVEIMVDSVNIILTSHQIHLHINYEKNRTVLTTMENGQKSKQIAYLPYAIKLDILNKKAIEQKVKLLTTFS